MDIQTRYGWQVLYATALLEADWSKIEEKIQGLVGLYLHLEKQLSGSQVQAVHKTLARAKREWPRVSIPNNRGQMTALDVLSAAAGPDRDRAIEDWCRSVWTAFEGNRQTIIALLQEYQIITKFCRGQEQSQSRRD
jgi:hypothetical protein